MVNFGKKVVKYRVLILILGVLLLIPSVFGYLNTRVNYDVLTYLPDNIETMKGQDILLDHWDHGIAAADGEQANLKKGNKQLPENHFFSSFKVLARKDW